MSPQTVSTYSAVFYTARLQCQNPTLMLACQAGSSLCHFMMVFGVIRFIYLRSTVGVADTLTTYNHSDAVDNVISFEFKETED